MDTKRDDNIKEVLKSAENSLVYETNRDEVKKQLIDEIQCEYSDKEIIDASCVKNFENYRKGNSVLNLLYDACKNVDTIEKEDEEVELD